MKIIEPSVEVWLPRDEEQHVARCARVCYKHEPRTYDEDKDKALVRRLVKNEHLSMFRHFTHYFFLPKKMGLDDKVLHKVYLSLYTCMGLYGGIEKTAKGTLFSINGQSYMELPAWMHNFLEDYRAKENDYFGTDERSDFWPVKVLEAYRTTVSMVTQISTSRELNRVSPNNISEQSTRYVNFGKKGGICICKPHWYDGASWYRKFLARTAWRMQEAMYNIALWTGMKPEDARGFLPLDTATRVVYTYTNREWRHIFNLRVREKTGKAHPNAKYVCGLAKEAIERRMRMFKDNYTL